MTSGHGRLQTHDQPAADRLPDEGGPRAARAGCGARLGRARHLRQAARRWRTAARASCCTTARRTRTGRSTSATAVNKILKDIVVKSRSLDGFDSPYIPGWDCHGLPIELQVEKKHGRPGQKLDAQAFRAACRAYAQEQVDLQRTDFKRLGILGDWERPVPHHGTALRGAAAARLRPHHQERAPLQGREAGALVPGLPLGAGRGGSGVRGEDLAGDRCRVPRRRQSPTLRPACRWTPPRSARCRSMWSSGPPPPGRCRRTRRWRCARSSPTCWPRPAGTVRRGASSWPPICSLRA